MKTTALFMLLLYLSLAHAQDNPAGRGVGPDGKVLVKADPAPASVPDPLPSPGTQQVQSWTAFLTELVTALGVIAALLQNWRTGGKVAAMHEDVKALAPPDPPAEKKP